MNHLPKAIASLYLIQQNPTYEYGVLDGCSSQTSMGAIIDSKTQKEIICDRTGSARIGEFVIFESKPYVRNLIRAYNVYSLKGLFHELHNQSLMKDKKEMSAIVDKITFLISKGASCNYDDFYVKKALVIYNQLEKKV